jgi:TRAP-type C4-dicarboxylate transport system substrate-binding protein
MASRDEPLFEGIDLIGVSTDMATLKKAVDSYRDVFDQRLQEKFNAKVMTLWPFGPQMFYCNADIKGVNDLKGLKIRSFTPSMSAMLKYFGATPVTLGFSEVYPALQKGVVSCGVTSPTSSNTGKWPEVTTHFMPLSVSGAVQGHFMNLDSWNKMSSGEQAELEKGFKKLENDLWDLANTVNDDAIRCIVGEEPCEKHTKYNLKRVVLSDSDTAKVKEAALEVVLPTWKKTCNSVDKNCTNTWNETVGKVTGMTIN